MSAQKMADDMHLDGWVIDALEAGRLPAHRPRGVREGSSQEIRRACSAYRRWTAAAAPDAKQPAAGSAGPDHPPAISPARRRPLCRGRVLGGGRGGRCAGGRRSSGGVPGTPLRACRRLRPPTPSPAPPPKPRMTTPRTSRRADARHGGQRVPSKRPRAGAAYSRPSTADTALPSAPAATAARARPRAVRPSPVHAFAEPGPERRRRSHAGRRASALAAELLGGFVGRYP